MRALLIMALLGLPHGCQTVPKAPPPTNVASAPALKTSADAQLSKASAAVAAAVHGNSNNIDSPAKTATAGALSVAAANLPPATAADVAEAMAPVDAALAGKLAEAQTAWAKARADATTLAARVHELELQVDHERQAAALELQRQLQEAREKADAKDRAIKTWLFFGLGTLLLLGGVASIFLKAYLPQLGPNVTLCLFAAGAVLILAGILVRAIERLIEDHPYIFWGGIVAAVVAVALAAGLVVANHHHASKPAV